MYNSKKRISELTISIHNIKLTTSEDLPLMCKSIFSLDSRTYIRFIHYSDWNYDRNVWKTIIRLEEKYLIKVIHERCKSVPKYFNRIMSYDIDNSETNIKRLIDCTND